MWTDAAYQFINLFFITLLALMFGGLGLWHLIKERKDSSNIFLMFLAWGGSFVALGLGGAWLFSGAPIIQLATFQAYELTLGFIRLYALGLSILLPMPILILVYGLQKLLRR